MCKHSVYSKHALHRELCKPFFTEFEAIQFVIESFCKNVKINKLFKNFLHNKKYMLTKKLNEKYNIYHYIYLEI